MHAFLLLSPSSGQALNQTSLRMIVSGPVGLSIWAFSSLTPMSITASVCHGKCIRPFAQMSGQELRKISCGGFRKTLSGSKSLRMPLPFIRPIRFTSLLFVRLRMMRILSIGFCFSHSLSPSLRKRLRKLRTVTF